MNQHSYVNGFRNIGVQIGLVEQVDPDLYWIQQNNETLLLPVQYQRNGRMLGQIDWEFELAEDECVKVITRAGISPHNELGVLLSSLQIERPNILDIYAADIPKNFEANHWRFHEPNKHYLSGVILDKKKPLLTDYQRKNRVAGVIWIRQSADEDEAIPVYCAENVYERAYVGMKVFVEANYKPSTFNPNEELPCYGWLRAYKISLPTQSDIRGEHVWMR